MLEKEVMLSVGKRLEILQITGEVVWYTRLNSGKVRVNGHYIQMCKPGTPDFVGIIRNRNKGLDLLFIECKRSDGKGRLSPDQIRFQKKYKDIDNVHYLVVDHPDYVSFYINDIAVDRLKEISL